MVTKLKKVLGFTALASVLTIPVIAQASSTVYNSTYDMTGGVESKRFSVNAPGTFQVETWGKESSSDDRTFTVYLKKDLVGPDETVSSKNDHYAYGYQSTKFNITTDRGSGSYYAYLRNFTGLRMHGDLRITVAD